MSVNNLRRHYSAKELVELSLACLPKTKQGILYQAKKQGWIAQEKVGIGGKILEFSLDSMPKHIQAEIYKKTLKHIPEALSKGELCIKREDLALGQLSDTQLNVASSRILLVRWFLAKERELGVNRSKVLDWVISAMAQGEIPEEIKKAIVLSNRKGKGKLILGKRTLYGWVLAYEAGENSAERVRQMVPLTHKKRTKPENLPWLADFLKVYQTFSNVSLTYAYGKFSEQYQGELPSEGQVRRALKQLPDYVVQQGRKTGAEMRALTPFVRRDTEVMEINECWVGDGHSFKAYVKSRELRLPYIPEVTAIIDVRTRLVVGWSIAESESVQAVGDALRHGILTNGCPNIYYSDNGRGQSNKTLDADLTGILPRLGIHHETGIAGNPQGRGIIERLWKSTLIPLAKEYQSYGGKDADNATKHWNYRKIQSAIKAKAKNKLLTDEQKMTLAKIPEFADFVADVTACFEAYNLKPHRSLPRNPQTGMHFAPLEYKEYLAELQNWRANIITPEESLLLFRPEVERVVERGEVHFDNKIYFHIELADYHGVKVRVCYDQHNPSSVLVKQMSGEVICEAILNGNKTPYMPESARESGRRRAVEAQIRRELDKVDILKARNRQAIELKADMSEVFKTPLVQQKQKKVYALFEAEYEETKDKKAMVG